MSAALYTTDILRLALTGTAHPRLSMPHGSAELRTPICGSRMIVDATLDADGRVAAIGMDVHACAMGQATAGLFATAAPGRTRSDIIAARAGLAEWLGGARAVPPDWPGIDALSAARAYPARHAAILLPFDAAIMALEQAQIRLTTAA